MKLLCILINIIGGIGLLATYAHGLSTHQNSVEILWGGVPHQWRNMYGIGMILAAIGYLSCAYYVLFILKTQEIKIFNTFNYSLFIILYILMLAPSIAWMPLTFKMAAAPSIITWYLIRTVLLTVGISALWMVITLLGLQGITKNIPYWIAICGSILFCAHTLILDALIWPHFWRQ